MGGGAGGVARVGAVVGLVGETDVVAVGPAAARTPTESGTGA